MVLHECCAQKEVTILYLVAGLFPTEKLKNKLLCISLEEKAGLCSMTALLFFNSSSFASAFSLFPD